MEPYLTRAVVRFDSKVQTRCCVLNHQQQFGCGPPRKPFSPKRSDLGGGGGRSVLGGTGGRGWGGVPAAVGSVRPARARLCVHVPARARGSGPGGGGRARVHSGGDGKSPTLQRWAECASCGLEAVCVPPAPRRGCHDGHAMHWVGGAQLGFCDCGCGVRCRRATLQDEEQAAVQMHCSLHCIRTLLVGVPSFLSLVLS